MKVQTRIGGLKDQCKSFEFILEYSPKSCLSDYVYPPHQNL